MPQKKRSGGGRRGEACRSGTHKKKKKKRDAGVSLCYAIMEDAASQLPDDVVQEIFTHLSSQVAGMLLLASKQHNKFQADDSMWRQMARHALFGNFCIGGCVGVAWFLLKVLLPVFMFRCNYLCKPKTEAKHEGDHVYFTIL
jgi:hypothetical protein